MVRTNEQLLRILADLRALPSETELVEFKRSYAEPKKIGKYISALSNSAAELGSIQPAWMVWGIDDTSHEIVGTDFQPYAIPEKRENLMHLLQRALKPLPDFRFHSVKTKDAKHVVMLEVPPASGYPVEFESEAYIRFGANNMLLKRSREKQKSLWQVLNAISFEEGIAEYDIPFEQIAERLDVEEAVRLLGVRGDLYETMEEKKLIAKTSSGRWNIHNLGAILFARKLESFSNVRYKAARIIHYKGPHKTSPASEYKYDPAGYAVDIAKLVKAIMDMLRTEEFFVGAKRYDTLLPENAIRELLANALIHQDLNMQGNRPLVEIYSDRVEITNAGNPLIATSRFLNHHKTRNVSLAQLMYEMGFCEQRGLGIDLVVKVLEERRLPAPLFEDHEDFIRIKLLVHNRYMTRDDKINACYWHACAKYAEIGYMTNASLRERLGIAQPAEAFRIISITLAEGLVKSRDPKAGKKARKYVPFWATMDALLV